MADDLLTVEAVREAVARLIAAGQLADPQTLRLERPHLVLDIDDHLSDEAIAGGRVRVVLRSTRELALLARALDEAAGRRDYLPDPLPGQRRRGDVG